MQSICQFRAQFRGRSCVRRVGSLYRLRRTRDGRRAANGTSPRWFPEQRFATLWLWLLLLLLLLLLLVVVPLLACAVSHSVVPRALLLLRGRRRHSHRRRRCVYHTTVARTVREFECKLELTRCSCRLLRVCDAALQRCTKVHVSNFSFTASGVNRLKK